MKKLQTLFTIPHTVESSTPEAPVIQQDERITLNELTLLSKMQAITRYNLGAASIRRVAEDCGAIVRIGRRVAYHRQTLDDFFARITE